MITPRCKLHGVTECDDPHFPEDALLVVFRFSILSASILGTAKLWYRDGEYRAVVGRPWLDPETLEAIQAIESRGSAEAARALALATIEYACSDACYRYAKIGKQPNHA